jgi:hypothetical protein
MNALTTAEKVEYSKLYDLMIERLKSFYYFKSKSRGSWITTANTALWYGYDGGHSYVRLMFDPRLPLCPSAEFYGDSSESSTVVGVQNMDELERALGVDDSYIENWVWPLGVPVWES